MGGDHFLSLHFLVRNAQEVERGGQGSHFFRAEAACGFTDILGIFHPEMLRREGGHTLCYLSVKTASHVPALGEYTG